MSRYHHSPETFKRQLKEYTEKTFEASQTEEGTETQSLQEEFKNLRRLLENLLFQNGYDFSMTPSPDNE